MSKWTTATGKDSRVLPSFPEAAYWTTPVGPVPHSGFQDFGMALIIFFPALSVIVLALRFYSKFVAKRFGMDDWFILAAVVLIVPQAIFAGIYLKMGYWGIHDADLPSRPFNQGMFWNYLNQVFYNPVLSLVKISALIFLLRVGGTKRRVNIACTGMIWFNMLQLLAFLPIVIFQCHPIAYNWRGTVEKGSCIKGAIFSVCLAVINVITDILTLWIPFWAFLDLKVNRRVKNALLGVFCLGGLVVAMGAVRLYFIIRSFYLKPADSHYSLGYTTNTIEINLAVLCASAPALWPLFRRWCPGMFQSLGLDRPYLYPDIEVGYATQKSRVSHLAAPPKSLRVKVSWKEHRKTPSWVDRGKSPSAASSSNGTEDVGGGGAPLTQVTRPRGNTQSTVRGGAGDEGSSSPRSCDTFYDDNVEEDERDYGEDESETYHGVIRPSPSREREREREREHDWRRDTIGQAR